MGWGFREYMHKIGTGVNPNPPCSIGMDVAFLIDYTGSMGGVIDTVKAAVGDIVTAIDTEVGAGNYRLGLVISDEYNGVGLPTYNGSAGYIALPAPQKDVNAGIGHTQYNTAMELFSSNNDASFTTQLNLLNTGPFPLGNGDGIPEPLDMALDLVVNSNFLNSFRINVAKYVLIFTDAPPGGDDDVYNGTDDAKVATLTTDCIDAGIKVFVIGGGATQTVWQDLATNTGGTFNTSFDSEVIISEIIASCQELEAPVADAGIDQVIQIPTTSVSLDGSASFDLDGTIDVWLWEKISGGTGTITTPAASMTTVTGLEWGDYVFKLTVTDNDALVDTDSMALRVDPEAAITFDTTSTLAAWQANTVTNGGSILRWELTGGVANIVTANQPILDLSLNGSTVNGYIGDTIGVTDFNVAGLSITAITLTGNTGLLTLNVGDNTLTALDVTDNTALTSLSFYTNNIATVDLSLNTALTQLSCFDAGLTSLNVNANTSLDFLSCSDNNLGTLSVALNTALLQLECSNTSISALDVTNNTLLTDLTFGNNTVSTIDLSLNTALTLVNCINNSLTNLVITNNTLLTDLRCHGNVLVAGDIDNIIIQLDTNGLSNGFLSIPTGRTAASDAARTNLISNGWTVNEI
jgi:hypothetical protein